MNGDTATTQIRVFGTTRDLSKIINQAVATPHRTAIPLTNAEMVAQTVDRPNVDRAVRDPVVVSARPAHRLRVGGRRAATSPRPGSSRSTTSRTTRSRRTVSAASGSARSAPPTSRAATVWALLSQVDISDEVTVTVQSPGGGGYEAVAVLRRGCPRDRRAARSRLRRRHVDARPLTGRVLRPPTRSADGTRSRPTIHGRDHSRGGTDPAYHAWEDVGSSGGGGGGGSGGVTEIDSVSLDVTDNTGPVTQIEQPAYAVEELIAGGNLIRTPSVQLSPGRTTAARS